MSDGRRTSNARSLSRAGRRSRGFSNVFQEEEATARTWEPNTIAHYLLGHHSVPVLKPHSGSEIIKSLLGYDSFSLRFAAMHRDSLEICESLFINLLTADIESNPALRACAAYSAARAFGCMYTSSQVASMGTLSTGAGQFLPIIRLAYDEQLQQKVFSEPAKKLLRFASSITAVPTQAEESDRVALALHYSESEEQAMVLACGFVSYFSRFNSTLGTPLEYLALLNSEKYLKPENDTELRYLRRWCPGVHLGPLDACRLQEESLLAEDDAPNIRPVPFKRLAQFHLVDHSRLLGIPRTIALLKVLLRKELGFVPYYLVRFGNTNARRSIVYAVLKGLGKQYSPYLSPGIKFAMCFLQAHLADNDILRAHFAFLAFHSGIPLSYLESLLAGEHDSDMFSPEEILAFRLAQATRSMPGNVDRRVSKTVVDRIKPDAVIEMTTALAVGSLLQTVTAAYPPTGYEEEVKYFVRFAHEEGFPSLRSQNGLWMDWDNLSRGFRASRVRVKSRAKGIFVV